MSNIEKSQARKRSRSFCSLKASVIVFNTLIVVGCMNISCSFWLLSSHEYERNLTNRPLDKLVTPPSLYHSKQSLTKPKKIAFSASEHFLLNENNPSLQEQVSQRTISDVFGKEQLPPPPLSARYLSESQKPDYGGLEIQSFGSERQISSKDARHYEQYRGGFLVKHDAPSLLADQSYGFYYNDPDEDVSSECRRPNWVGLQFPTCNQAHELSLNQPFGKNYPLQPYNYTALGYVHLYHHSTMSLKYR